jgi:vacuolar-type H+-ATPase subunit F/Vma7
MSWRVRTLASQASAPGFRLAGLAVDEVREPREMESRLALAATQADLVILLVEQALLDAVPPLALRAFERRAVPILVPIPKPRFGPQEGEGESYILELLRRAIGYRVRLQ